MIVNNCPFAATILLYNYTTIQLSIKHIIYLWRAILWSVAICVLTWLFWQNLIPTGVLVLSHKKGGHNSPISDLQPLARIINLPTDGGNQRFYTEPVYFNVKAPHEFSQVIITLSWQNQAQPILELGARKSWENMEVVLKPLQNKIIDNLAWPCQREAEVLFCQKIKHYKNLAEFLAHPPDSGVLIYRYNLPKEIKAVAMTVNTNPADYAYLLTTYTPPTDMGNDWWQRTLTFNWHDFTPHFNEIGFLLSAPEINQGYGQIVLGDLTVTLKRPPFDWQGLWKLPLVFISEKD